MRGDHSSRPWLAPWLKQPTRGLLFAAACAAVKGARSSRLAALQRQTARTLTRRAGPALPSYLALHHAGFSVPHALLRERWALTPPFHPYQRIVRRRLAGFPARRHRAVPRRSVFCGTFRERIALPQAEACMALLAPLALPGALPFPLNSPKRAKG